MQVNFDRFQLIPVLGRSGSGKSELLKQLHDHGHQVASIEEIAGVKGVCLAHTFASELISQREFETRLCQHFQALKAAYPVWVEWKGDKVTGLNIPSSFSKVVRLAGGVFIEASLEERVDRLLRDYEAWHDHLDLITAGLREKKKVCEDLAERLDAKCESNDVRGYFETLVVEHFDPEYDREIEGFPIILSGRMKVGRTGLEFNGQYRPQRT